MRRQTTLKHVRDLMFAAVLMTGCSLMGDFGAFEDEPVGDGDLTGGNGNMGGDGDGDLGGSGDGDAGGDGDGDGDTGGNNLMGDGDTGGNNLMGDGDGDTGGDPGNGDGDGDTGGDSGDGDTGTGGSDDGAGGTEDPGTGGAGSGGAPGTGGEEMGTGGSVPTSPGCGASNHPTTGSFTITANGKEREYILELPSDYDPTTPYPITFGFHPIQSTAASVVSGNFFGLKNLAGGTMIFVAPQGLNDNWANSGGEDVLMVGLILDRLEEELCIDTSRVFSVGFSAGGMFSNAVGCALGDRFRAIASYSGALTFGCQDGSEPVAYLGTHGQSDGTVPITSGENARDEFITRSGCSATTVSPGSNGCVQYEGCDSDAPVVWCEFAGGHMVPAFAAAETWDFFSQF